MPTTEPQRLVSAEFPKPWEGPDPAAPSTWGYPIAFAAITMLFTWLGWLGDQQLHVPGGLGPGLGVVLVGIAVGSQLVLTFYSEQSISALVYRPFVAWYPSLLRRRAGMLLALVPWAAISAICSAPAIRHGSTDGLPRFFLWALPTGLGGIVFALWRVTAPPPSTSKRPARTPLAALPKISAATSGVTLLHLSDLHVTAGRNTIEGEPSPDARLSRFFTEHASEIAHTDVVLTTGDMTDAGLASEWKQFFEIVKSCPGLARKLVLVPGNHDVSVSGARKRDGDKDWVGRSVRLIRMMGAIRCTHAARSFVLHEGSVRRVDHILDAEAAEMRHFVMSPPVRVYEERQTAYGGSRADVTPEAEIKRFDVPKRLWDRLFPMAVELKPGCYVIVFDSNLPAGTIATNALGEIPDEKLQRATELSAALKTQVGIVALHHQLDLPSADAGLWDLLTDHALTLNNASVVFDWFATHPGVVVFHGHRHFAHESTYLNGSIAIISARSTTLGDPRQKYPPGARRFRITSDVAGSRIAESETLELSSASPASAHS